MIRRLLKSVIRSRCFARCVSDQEYSQLEQAKKDGENAADDTTLSKELIESNLTECAERQRAAEMTMMCCLQRLRVLTSNMDSDPYPELLVYRIKAQVKARGDAEHELKMIIKVQRQLRLQLTTLRESELNTRVICALKSVLQSNAPNIRLASDCSDDLLDDIDEQQHDVAETTRKLAICRAESDAPSGESCAESDASSSNLDHHDASSSNLDHHDAPSGESAAMADTNFQNFFGPHLFGSHCNPMES
jgi:hypothetical protein